MCYVPLKWSLTTYKTKWHHNPEKHNNIHSAQHPCNRRKQSAPQAYFTGFCLSTNPTSLSLTILWNATDTFHQNHRFYSTACEYGTMRKLGCCTEMCMKEFLYQIQLHNPQKSVVAAYSTNSCHHILLHDARILATTLKTGNRIISEATAIQLHANVINRDECFYPSESW